jgi:lipopolysaccharide transport system permease protein
MGEFKEEPTQSPSKNGATFGENFDLQRGGSTAHLSFAVERFTVLKGAQYFASRLWTCFGLSETPQKASGQAILKIRPQAHWSLVNFREMWEYRDLLWTLAVRDLKLRYRQTSLGILWVVFQPVAGAGVFALVFGWVAGMAAGKQSYFVFSLAGLLVWTAFQSTLLKCSMALLGNGALVSKVYFPRLLLPLSTLLSTLVDFAIGLVVFVVAGLLTGWRPDWLGLLTLPVWLAAALLTSSGVGLLAAALMTRFRDVQHALPTLLTFLMYASPVAYALSAVPEKWKPIFYWNPVTWMLEGARAALLGTTPVSGMWMAYALGCSLTLFGLGVLCFRKMERSFADVF